MLSGCSSLNCSYMWLSTNIIVDALLWRYILLSTLSIKLLWFEYAKDLHNENVDFSQVYVACEHSTFNKFYRIHSIVCCWAKAHNLVEKAVHLGGGPLTNRACPNRQRLSKMDNQVVCFAIFFVLFSINNHFVNYYKWIYIHLFLMFVVMNIL